MDLGWSRKGELWGDAAEMSGTKVDELRRHCWLVHLPHESCACAPVAALCSLLLFWALWQALRVARGAGEPGGTALRGEEAAVASSSAERPGGSLDCAVCGYGCGFGGSAQRPSCARPPAVPCASALLNRLVLELSGAAWDGQLRCSFLWGVLRSMPCKRRVLFPSSCSRC